MKHGFLLLTMAALAISTGSFAQSTTSQTVRKAAETKRILETRKATEAKNQVEVQKATETQTQNKGWGSQEALRKAAKAVKEKQEAEAKAAEEQQKNADKARRDEINKYFSDNVNKDNAKALTINVAEEELPAYIQVGSKALELVSEDVKVDNQSSQIFAANYENIYPGAIVFADGRLANGDPTLAFDGGTVDLRVNFNTGNRSRTNVTNTAAKVYDEIGSMLVAAQFKPTPTAQYKSYYSSSLSEMAVGMKANADFLKVNAKVDINTSKSETHVYETQDFTQEYYTVSITQHPNDQSLYFADNVTRSQIESKIRNHGGAPLAVITSVTYGRRAYKFYDYSTKDFKFKGSEEVTAYGQSLSSTQDIAEKSETKNIWIYVSGGNVESTGTILKGDVSINTAVAENMKYDDKTNWGVPLYYTVRFIASGRTATVATTGSYKKVSYQELPGSVTYTFRNNCSRVAGAGLKMRLDYKVVKFINGEKVEVGRNRDAESGYTRYTEHNIGFDDKKTGLLDLGPGEFIDGPLRFQVRCKTTSEGKWHNDVVCKVIPTDGEIDVNIHGAIRPGGTAAYIYSSSKTKALKER
ncbi:MAG: thiol-activated cytolysin family protein [Bacteroidales bacterium]|nr:thiol-activated cytolysin family protein [Bacteroidales bacterium]